MRILVLSYAADEEAARSGSLTGLLARRPDELAVDLAELGHLVHLVEVAAAGGRLRSGGAARSLPHARATSATTAPGRELSELLGFGPDVVLGVGELAGRSLDLLAAGLRCPWVWSPDTAVRRAADVPTTATRVISQSQHGADQMPASALAPGACDVVPWRLASDVVGPGSAADVPLRARSALAVADPGHDGIADAVRALALLPEHRLVVAVDARRSPDDVRARRWVKLAQGLGVGPRLRVVPVESASALRALLGGAGLLVTVPRQRFQRELVATAMWCGTAVVASDLEGARELVETGCSGLVLPPGDPWRLARAVRMMTTDARGRGLWAWSARRRIRELAGPEVVARGVAAALTRAALFRPAPSEGELRRAGTG